MKICSTTAVTLDDVEKGIKDVVASFRQRVFHERYLEHVHDFVDGLLATVLPVTVVYQIRITHSESTARVHVDFNAFDQGFINDQIVVDVPFLAMWD